MGTRATPAIAYGFNLGAEEEDMDAIADLIEAADDLNDRDWPVHLISHGHYEYRYFFLSIRGTYKGGGDWGDVLPCPYGAPSEDKIEAAKAWCKEHGIEWRGPMWCAFAVYH